MNELDKMRSEHKQTMMIFEQSRGAEISELETKIGKFYVTTKDDTYVSLYDTDQNWLMPVDDNCVIDDLYGIISIDQFAEVLGIAVLVAHEDKQELVKLSQKAGIDDYDLIYHIGNIYFMFDTPELINLTDFDN